MDTLFIILCALAYLLGSVPTAVWVGRIFFGVDVREHGSGNAGATNTLRVLGRKAGISVLLIDYLKGVGAAMLAWLHEDFVPGTSEHLNLQMLLGALAVIGHIYPVFARFRGGKGIATLIGVVTAMDYRLALMCLAVFVIVVFASRFISLGSMVSAVLSPLFAWMLHGNRHLSFICFCIGIAIVVVYTHRSNIRRLLSGTENRFSFSSSGPTPKAG